MTPLFRITEGPDGRWIITHPRDPSMIWCGSHWAYRDQGAPVTSFTSFEAAEHYACTILGGAEVVKP